MYYYKHHMGDFNNATRHLTRIQRSIYRDLLELYYDTEEPISSDAPAVARKIIAVTEAEITAVEQMLNEFFVLLEGRYFNDRCEQIILAYHLNNKNKSKAGKASAKAKRLAKAAKALKDNAKSSTAGVEQVLDSVSTEDQQNANTGSTNQEPLTTNHKPQTILNNTPSAPSLDWSPFGYLTNDELSEVKRIRKKNKGGAWSQRIINATAKEIRLARDSHSIDEILTEWDVRGWQAFKAAWMKSNTGYQTAQEKAAARNEQTFTRTDF